jgi:8-oxo-dGTP pyrophosphatase MutT (NUDIX family)
MAMKPKICGVVLKRTSGETVEYLLVRQCHMWSFPKGHPEKCDTDDMDTAIRELKEETGIVLSKEGLSFEKRMRVGNEKRLYLVDADEQKAHIMYPPTFQKTREISEVKWMTREEVSKVKYNMFVARWIRSVY